MSHAPYTPEEYKKNVSKIWKTTGLLSLVTIAEVIIAIKSDDWNMSYGLLAFIVSVASIIKAVYIMGVFMHLGQETKGFKFAMLFPFILLIWGFVSFSLEGMSAVGMREAINTILPNWGF